MTPPGDTNRPNGENTGGSLSERVRSLRLADKTGPAAPPRINKLPWAFCVVLLGVTALFGYRAYRVGPALPPEEGEERATTRGEGKGPAPTSPAATPGEVVLQAKGYVTLFNPVQVGPIVGGRLVWVSEKLLEGAWFEAGAELAKVEDVEYKADRDQARASLEAATQRFQEMENGMRPEEVEQARAEFDEASRTLKRLKLDLERGRRLAATSALATREYEEARYGFEAQEQRVRRLDQAFKLMRDGVRIERRRVAEAEMKQAAASLMRAQWRLDNTVVKAPIAGVVLSKRATEGQQVNPAALGSGISASLCDIADLRDLEIDLSIQERDIANVHEDQKCQVMPEAYQNHEPFLKKYPQGFPGFVSRLMPQADRSKGAIPVRVRIPRASLTLEEARKFLRPDTGALVTFLRASPDQAPARKDGK